MRKTVKSLLLASTVIALGLAGCGSSNAPPPPPPPVIVVPPPPPPPPPPAPPPPPPTSFNVTACLNQTVVPGRTLADLVVPDTLRVNLTQASGFPNGRRYQDPVIDITLAAIFLDLRVHPVTLFANLPLNPSGNDRPFATTFPFLPAPQGTQPVPQGGTNFNFRTEPASAYARIDRAGMPAVATALIGGPLKNPYNDDNPAIDATARYVPELSAQLTALTNALADDFRALNLTMCATPA